MKETDTLKDICCKWDECEPISHAVSGNRLEFYKKADWHETYGCSGRMSYIWRKILFRVT